MSYENIIASVVVAAGWFISAYMSNWLTRIRHKRELRTGMLLTAYKTLTEDVSHREMSAERAIKLENVISNLQLLGSLEQISLTKRLADDAARNNSFELDPIVNSIRSELRRELGLPQVNGNVKWFRYINSI